MGALILSMESENLMLHRSFIYRLLQRNFTRAVRLDIDFGPRIAPADPRFVIKEELGHGCNRPRGQQIWSISSTPDTIDSH
jgi:hypothetical protein